MKRFLIMAVVIITAACAPAPFKPEPAHPTPERMAELLALPVKDHGGKRAALRFEARVCPGYACTAGATMLAGAGSWVQCLVPADHKAFEITIALEGHNSSTHSLDRIESRLWIEHVSCGTWRAICSLSNGETREVQLVAKGECNSGEDK